MDQVENQQIAYWMEQAVANLGEHSEKTLEYCSLIFSYVESDRASFREDYDMY